MQNMSDINQIAIVGPVFGAWGKYLNMNLLFLGDLHNAPTTINEGCDITKYLDNLFSNVTNKTDFYIEAPYRTMDIKAKPYLDDIDKCGYLRKLKAMFHDCLYYKDTKYNKNVRFHYIDIRFRYQCRWDAPKQDSTDFYWFVGMSAYIEYIIIKMRRILIEFSKTMSHTEDNLNFISHVKYFIDKFFGTDTTVNHVEFLRVWMTSDNYYQDIEYYVNKLIPDNFRENDILTRWLRDDLMVKRRNKIMSKGRAQLEALENENQKYIADKIVKFILEEQQQINIEEIHRYIKKIEKFCVNITKMDKDNIVDYIDKKINRLSRFYVYNQRTIVDVYLLGRLFRFNNPDNPVINKIVFAGLAHIDLYTRFFKSLGVKIIENGTSNIEAIQIHNDDNIKKCINIDNNIL